jgi:hypothetical protein
MPATAMAQHGGRHTLKQMQTPLLTRPPTQIVTSGIADATALFRVTCTSCPAGTGTAYCSTYLSGTTAVSAVDGVATIDSVKIEGPVGNYTLVITPRAAT